ncbi:hypothetical protein MMC12_003937 [Toensbergia leucococca]|nr:hypothetical protein [Toensbergia leucococca]
MPWRPLPRIAFAVATYPFQPNSPADLPLELGDELYVIEQGGANGSWYRGYLVAPPSLLAGLTSTKGQTLEARVFSGIFPRNCVEVREVLGDIGVNEQDHTVGLEDSGLSSTSINGDGRSSLGYNGSFNKGGSGNGSIRPTLNGESGHKLGDGDVTCPSAPSRDLKKAHARAVARSKARRSKISRKLQASARTSKPDSEHSREPNGKRPPAPVPMLKIGDETPTSSIEPLVDEIASCLREWHSTNLHELLLSRQYIVLEKLSELVRQLDLSRRQLLHGVLTRKELGILREKTVWDLAGGNKMLCNETIVRDPKQRGRLLTGDDSAIEMTKLQCTMSLLDQPSISESNSIDPYHLMVELKPFATLDLESPSLNIYLCSKIAGEPPKQLTEAFALDIPSTDRFKEISASGRLRTIFSDLSLTDVKKSVGTKSRLFLVVKVQANQLTEVPVQSSRAPAPRENHQSFDAQNSDRSLDSTPIKGSRRSFMWASKQLGGSDRHKGQQGLKAAQSAKEPPNISESLRRSDTLSVPRTPTQDGPQYVKRDVGVGVLDVGHFLEESKDVEKLLQIWSPASTSTEFHETEDEWDDLVRDLMTSRTGRFAKSRSIEHVNLHLQSLAGELSSALTNKTALLSHNVTPTPKIGFSDTPLKSRSDIFLTLSEASLPTQASLSHPERGSVQLPSSLRLRNIQLTLEVRKMSGERIENCIFPASNSPGYTAWRTSAVERGGAWNQTIKLVVPTADVPQSHLIMSVADAPGFPFALGWMPLWDQQACISDGFHTPRLYLYDKLTSSTDKGGGAYLAFPWSSSTRGSAPEDGNLTEPVAILKLETYLCSTVFSQDKILLGLFNWRNQSTDQLLELLQQLIFVPEIEIVKLVDNVFDSIFAILVDRVGHIECEDSVFNAFVMILGIVHDRRFNLGPLVDQYAQSRFNFPLACPCLIRSYLRLLSNPLDPKHSRQLRAAFKVGNQVLKFIVQGSANPKAENACIDDNNTQPKLNAEINALFLAFQSLMRDPSPVLVGSKTLVVQHMHTWLLELSGYFSQDEIFQLASDFLDSCMDVQSKLILHKLLLILHISKLSLFTKNNVRQQILESTATWIEPHWGSNLEATSQWREQIRLCCSIVVSQVVELGPRITMYFQKTIESYRTVQGKDHSTRVSLSLLFPITYPFPHQPISSWSAFDEALIELAALLAQLVEYPFTQQISHLGPDLADTISEALKVNMSILCGDAFPSSWLSLHVYHHRSSLQLLESLFEILVGRFLPSPDDADNFNTELWKAFFLTLLKLVRSDALALETFPEQKRRAVWKIAGDVREQGAELLRRSWEAVGWDADVEDQRQYGVQRMGGFQVQYVPSLVASIVELCLSVHEGLRNVAVEILQTMIISEWTLSEDLSVIQAEMIESLDVLFKSKNVGENVLQKLFVNELLDLFESLAQTPDDGLWLALKELLSTVGELLDLLGAVHSTDMTEAFRIMHTLQLMDFLRDKKKEYIFIRYVHQLAHIQAQLHNTTEAGLALRLHADLYTWDVKSVEALADPAFPKQSSCDRKEQLYFEMIKFFEEGQAWDCALASYRELADQYEHHHFDYTKLARTQHSMAKIYENIAKDERNAPRYYRVVYRGLGFPPSLRDKQFIFESVRSAKLSSFTDWMRQQHPSAQVTTSGDNEDIEGQYLQLFAVSPHRDLEHPLYQQLRVPQSTRDYLLSSRPARFAVTSRRHSPTSAIQDQWTEKTVYTTAEAFPNIMRRSEIVAIDVLRLSPLKTAVERTTRRTSDLAALAKRVTNGDESGFNYLTESIKSSVDPSSVASVSQYHQFLPPNLLQHTFDTTHESFLDPLPNALKIALIDHASALKHCLTLYSRPSHQATQSSLSQSLQSTFALELALLAPIHQPTPPSTSWLPNPLTTPSTPDSLRSPHINGTLLASSQATPNPRTTIPRPRSRISLAFLKPPQRPNGVHPPTPNDEPTSPSREHGSNRRSFISTEDGHALSSSGGAPKSSDGRGRPETAESGGMRKRLSMLGIGVGRGSAGVGRKKAGDVGSLLTEEGYL